MYPRTSAGRYDQHLLWIAHVEGVLQAQIPRMWRLDFTAGLIIVSLLLQSGDLSVGKHDAFSGDLFLKRLQAFTEVFQVVSLPDRAHAAAGDKYASFTQLITGSVLPMCREVNGIFNNRAFSGFIGTVLQVGNPAILINQRINAAFFSQIE